MINRKISRTVLFFMIFPAFFCAIPIIFSKPACSQVIKGRFSVDHYLTADSSPSQNYSITNIRLKFDIPHILRKNLAFSFNGSKRIKSNGNDLTDKIDGYRIFAFNIKYYTDDKRLLIGAGRQMVEDASGESVDGLNLKYSLSRKTSLGIFGGLKPDPYKEAFQIDYKTIGTYYVYASKMLNTQAGFVHDLYKNSTDRDHIFLRSYLVPSRIMSIRNLITVDISSPSGGTALTNFDIGTDITPIKKVSVSLNYAHFKPVQLKRSMTFTMDKNSQHRIAARAKVRVLRNLSFFTNYIFRLRGIDSKTSHTVEAGIFGEIPSTDIYYNTRYKNESYFTAKNSSIYFELQKTFFDIIDTGINLEYQRNNPDIEDNIQHVFIYRATADYFVTKMVYISIDYEYEQEADFTRNSIFSKIGVRF